MNTTQIAVLVMLAATICELLVAIYCLRQWKHWQNAYMDSFFTEKDVDFDRKKTQVVPMYHAPLNNTNVVWSNKFGWVQKRAK